MNKTHIASTLILAGLMSVTSHAFSAVVVVKTMSVSEYETSKDGIATQLKSAKDHCRSVTSNRKELTEICVANAERKEQIAKAKLEARYHPTEENRDEVLAVKAEARGDYLRKAKKDGAQASNATAADKLADKHRVADYAKVEDKCNSLGAAAKTTCLNKAEKRYNKQ